MLHKSRRHTITDVQSLEELVHKLHDYTWTTCTGFRFTAKRPDGVTRHLLFLNDSTSPDGAQEFGVIDEDAKVQFESITVGWIEAERLACLVTNYVETPLEAFDWQQPVHLAPHPSGYCTHCA